MFDKRLQAIKPEIKQGVRKQRKRVRKRARKKRKAKPSLGQLFKLLGKDSIVKLLLGFAGKGLGVNNTIKNTERSKKPKNMKLPKLGGVKRVGKGYGLANIPPKQAKKKIDFGRKPGETEEERNKRIKREKEETLFEEYPMMFLLSEITKSKDEKQAREVLDNTLGSTFTTKNLGAKFGKIIRLVQEAKVGKQLTNKQRNNLFTEAQNILSSLEPAVINAYLKEPKGRVREQKQVAKGAEEAEGIIKTIRGKDISSLIEASAPAPASASAPAQAPAPEPSLKVNLEGEATAQDLRQFFSGGDGSGEFNIQLAGIAPASRSAEPRGGSDVDVILENLQLEPQTASAKEDDPSLQPVQEEEVLVPKKPTEPVNDEAQQQIDRLSQLIPGEPLPPEQPLTEEQITQDIPLTQFLAEEQEKKKKEAEEKRKKEQERREKQLQQQLSAGFAGQFAGGGVGGFSAFKQGLSFSANDGVNSDESSIPGTPLTISPPGSFQEEFGEEEAGFEDEYDKDEGLGY